MKKMVKAQSTIISSVIILLIIFVCILIVWNAVHFLVSEKSNQIGIDQFITKINIYSTPVINNNCVDLSIKRDAGGGKLSGINFMFKNDSNDQENYIEKEESKLPKELERKDFQFCYPVNLNISNVTKVSFSPMFGNGGTDYYGIISEENPIKEILKDPISISNCAALQNMRFNLTANYELINDIDCSDTINWNNGKGFSPVANGTIQQSICSGNGFIGNFNGKGHKIYNLYINNYSGTCLGLFGDSRGNISNVGLINVTIFANSSLKLMAGGVVASNYGNIKNSYSIYNIQGKAYGGSAFLGGLVGDNHGNITNSYSIGNLSGGTYSPFFSSYIGGLIGLAWRGSNISNCYSVSSVNLSNGSWTYAGGLGGLVGKAYHYNEGLDKFIENSFAVPSINMNYTLNVGGILGLYTVSTWIINSYWNNNSNNPVFGCYSKYNGVMENINCTAIQNNPSYFYSKNNEPMARWNFETDWQENPGSYPTLK
jgi:hypothetical protein